MFICLNLFIYYLCDDCCLKGGKTATKCCMFTLKKKRNVWLSEWSIMAVFPHSCFGRCNLSLTDEKFEGDRRNHKPSSSRVWCSVMYWKKSEMDGLHSLLISNIPHHFNCYTSCCCCSICHLILYIKISRFSLLKFVQ